MPKIAKGSWPAPMAPEMSAPQAEHASGGSRGALQRGQTDVLVEPLTRRSDAEGFAAAACLGCVRVAELEAAAHQVVLEVDFGAAEVEETLGVADDAHA